MSERGERGVACSLAQGRDVNGDEQAWILKKSTNRLRSSGMLQVVRKRRIITAYVWRPRAAHPAVVVGRRTHKQLLEVIVLREFCAQNLTNVYEALRAGADRVELCDDLSVGGVTPADEVIFQAVECIHSLGGSVMVMIRPRGGDFAYGDSELRAMQRSIEVARRAGADGVVFGCVKNGRLDLYATERLAASSKGLSMTFHMAFDEIDPRLQPEALRELAQMGFDRVLTHGGPLSMRIEQCIPHLHELVIAAGDAISIMPGGGVTWQNAEAIGSELGVREVHGTKIVRF